VNLNANPHPKKARNNNPNSSHPWITCDWISAEPLVFQDKMRWFRCPMDRVKPINPAIGELLKPSCGAPVANLPFLFHLSPCSAKKILAKCLWLALRKHIREYLAGKLHRDKSQFLSKVQQTRPTQWYTPIASWDYKGNLYVDVCGVCSFFPVCHWWQTHLVTSRFKGYTSWTFLCTAHRVLQVKPGIGPQNWSFESVKPSIILRVLYGFIPWMNKFPTNLSREHQLQPPTINCSARSQLLPGVQNMHPQGLKLLGPSCPSLAQNRGARLGM
jgi:hypothetical protein